MSIQIDQPVPHFTSLNQDKANIAIGDYKGKNVLLYFYPKDDTPGCTLESCGFRDAFDKISALNTVILGISMDSPVSHQKFRAKYDLPFDLLSDREGELCKLFDVLKEKSMFGKKYMGIERSSFLIDSQGILRAQWRKVTVIGHVNEVLKTITGLKGA